MELMLIDLLESSKAIGLCPMGILEMWCTKFMKGELRTLGLKLERTRHFMIRFKNGGLFNLDRGQLNLGKLYA